MGIIPLADGQNQVGWERLPQTGLPLLREFEREGILGDRRGAGGDSRNLSPEGHGDCREFSVEATV